MTKLLRITNVLAVTGMSKTCVYDAMKNSSFPRPVRLGTRSVAWRDDEIQAWVESRPRVEATQDLEYNA